jgi:hypothetical protein
MLNGATTAVLTSAKTYTDGATGAVLIAANTVTAGATNAVLSTATNLANVSALAAIGGATNATVTSLDIYRIFLYGSANQITASNQWILNPYNVGVASASSQFPIPSKYRYIRQYVVIIPGLLGYGETNWLGPSVIFGNPTNYQYISNSYESQCGQGNNFAGMYNAWTGFPNVWVRTLYNSGSSRNGIVWKMTNSVPLPASWWTNATAMPGDSFFFIFGNVINANTIAMSNGAPPSGYIEFSTTP